MNSPPTFSSVEIEASEWLVMMSEPGLSEAEQRRFQSWLQADPEHERVFRAQRQAWALAGQMQHLLEQPATRSRRRRVFERTWPIAAALAVALVGGMVFHFGGAGAEAQRFATEIAQIKEVRLEDGSLISLGAASRIKVDFSSQARRVTLLGGQAFFDVTHDPTRPFLVDAGATTVRVVGTQFDVNYAADAVRVSVLRGKVEVLDAVEHPGSAAPASQAAQGAHALTAGQGAVVSRAGHLDSTFPVAVENLGAWRSGRLVYVDARLLDVIADVNRYYDGRIELAAPQVGDLRLTVAFRTDQIDRMLDVLTRALPIQVEHVGARQIRLSLRRE